MNAIRLYQILDLVILDNQFKKHILYNLLYCRFIRALLKELILETIFMYEIANKKHTYFERNTHTLKETHIL